MDLYGAIVKVPVNVEATPIHFYLVSGHPTVMTESAVRGLPSDIALKPPPECMPIGACFGSPLLINVSFSGQIFGFAISVITRTAGFKPGFVQGP